jgi:hypothetical protein
VEVPRGLFWSLLIGSLIGRWRLNRAIDDASKPAQELARYLGDKWRVEDQREQELLALQASIEKLTRWLVILTVLLGLIAIASIGITLWET